MLTTVSVSSDTAPALFAVSVVVEPEGAWMVTIDAALPLQSFAQVPLVFFQPPSRLMPIARVTLSVYAPSAM